MYLFLPLLVFYKGLHFAPLFLPFSTLISISISLASLSIQWQSQSVFSSGSAKPSNMIPSDPSCHPGPPPPHHSAAIHPPTPMDGPPWALFFYGGGCGGTLQASTMVLCQRWWIIPAYGAHLSAEEPTSLFRFTGEREKASERPAFCPLPHSHSHKHRRIRAPIHHLPVVFT